MSCSRCGVGMADGVPCRDARCPQRPTATDPVRREVRGLLVSILSNHPDRGRIVHAMGGTYQTYGDLVDAVAALLSRPAEGTGEAVGYYLQVLWQETRDDAGKWTLHGIYDQRNEVDAVVRRNEWSAGYYRITPLYTHPPRPVVTEAMVEVGIAAFEDGVPWRDEREQVRAIITAALAARLEGESAD